MSVGRDVVAAEGRFQLLADSVSDGIVLADEHSEILAWSRGAERMFGWSSEEMVGRALTEIMPERFREAHLAGLRRLQETGEPHLLGKGPVSVSALGADGREFAVELSLGRWTAGGDDVFVGIIRDVSAREEAERYRAAQYGVARALAEAATVDAAVEGVLRAMGESLGWPLGALWLVDEPAGVLRDAGHWHAPDTPVAEFERLSRESTFEPGAGLPGRTWQSKEVAWISDVQVDANFPRVRAAAAEGLHAAVALPLVADGAVIGVVEFFDREIRAPAGTLEALMVAMGEQVAQFLARKRAEERLDAVGRRERQATEINDLIIEHLVQATQALDRGDLRAARRELTETLEHASRIITELRGRRA